MRARKTADILGVISMMALCGCSLADIQETGPIISEDTTRIRPERILGRAPEAKTDEVKEEEAKEDITITFKSGSFSIYDEEGREVYKRSAGYLVFDEYGNIKAASRGTRKKDKKAVLSDNTYKTENHGYGNSVKGSVTLKDGKYTIVTNDARSKFDSEDDERVSVIKTDGRVSV